MSKIKPWKLLSRESIFFKYGRGIDKVMYEMTDGSPLDFYIKNESDGVAVLALTQDNKVLLVRQYRPGPDAIYDEIPGGAIDEGESPEEAAARELLEETGYKGDIRVVSSFSDDAYSNKQRYAAVATNCQKIAEPVQTASEQLELVIKPLDEFREQLKKGLLTDSANAYLALDYAGLL